MFRVSGGGGEPEALTTLDTEQDEVRHTSPFIIPEHEAVLFVISTGRPRETGQLAVLELDTGEVTRLGVAGVNPHYTPTGHLVYAVEEGSVRAVPFDAASLEVRGSPIPLVEGVRVKVTGAADFSISDNGRLVYALGRGTEGEVLAWVDRDLQREELGAEPLDYRHPRVSPDGTRIAVSVAEDSGGRDIQVYDLARGAWTRLTVDPAVEDYPLWAPDGQSVVFRSTRGEGGVYQRAADGTGAVELLTTGSSTVPFSYARDGTVLVFGQTLPDTRDDLFVLPLDAEQTPTPLLQTGFSEEHAALSPDGRWLAYTSDEAGSEAIYVRRFPNIDDGKVTISVETGSAREPLWGPDGQELFYKDLRTQTLMAVSIETEPTFRAGTPEPVFDVPAGAGGGVQYDVAPDGQRFLFVLPGDDGPATPQINVVLNWHQELLERVRWTDQYFDQGP